MKTRYLVYIIIIFIVIVHLKKKELSSFLYLKPKRRLRDERMQLVKTDKTI